MKRLLILLLMFSCVRKSNGQSAHVGKVVDSIIARENFNGVVLIAKNGRQEYIKYSGIADRKNGIEFSPESRFKIFSVTKTFTATLIMKLYEEGKLNLDSTISKYYPEYKGEGAYKITIRNLLTYSSGRDCIEMKLIAEAYNTTIWPVDTFIDKYCSEKLINRPGTKFDYNNGDYIILGRIIEKLYGKSFQEALKEQILSLLKCLTPII